METINLPCILTESISENQARFDLTIPSDLVYFQGHFKEFPLLPGVVQIHWVMYFAEKLGETVVFGGMNRVKFMRPIRPNDGLTLELNLNPENNILYFRYFDTQNTYSSGRININGQYV